jgi:hypothetical protein
MGEHDTLASIERIGRRILFVRGCRVILDADLAALYGVTTKQLNQQIRRNRDRFPTDFVFQLSVEEKTEVVASCNHLAGLKHSTSLPFAFTEHGTIMAASVLSTKRAVDVSVFVVRAFVSLREAISGHREIVRKLHAVEQRVSHHDVEIREILIAIRRLIQPLPRATRKIGFGSEEK